jgi:hypothetical protein
MADWKDWSDGWLREGYFISYMQDNVRYYEHVLQCDFGHYVYTWPEVILPLTASGPFVPEELEITRGYDVATNSNQIWQVIFGIKGQVYIYVELPTDIHRHGIPKVPKPGTAKWDVSHFEEWMSPFHEPSFITEHFMIRPLTFRIALSAYNPNMTWQLPVLNIFLNKIVTERLGYVQDGNMFPTYDRFRETLDKLYRRVIPHRPITLLPVRAPAEAPSGE